MKAAQFSEYGDASKVQIVEVEKPEPKQGQVLVKVHASSLNPFDSSVREGHMKEMIPLDLPVTLGGDIAGVVESVADGVNDIAVGDKVYGQANVVAGNSGAFAEFATTSNNQVAKMPNNLDFLQAASLPLVGVSAWQALSEHIKLSSGQKIFIHGGAGGIGSIAIQIAKHIGAYVAATATGDDLEFLKKLGTDEVIDYKQDKFYEKLKDFDAVFDTTPGQEFTDSLRILKSGGVAVSMLAGADEAEAAEKGVTAITQSTQVTKEALNALSELVESGVVEPEVSQVFELDKIREAFEARETSNSRGKVVLSIQ